MSKAIRVGDKISNGKVTYEVIGTLPGGKVELFDRAASRFVTVLHRQAKTWQAA